METWIVQRARLELFNSPVDKFSGNSFRQAYMASEVSEINAKKNHVFQSNTRGAVWAMGATLNEPIVISTHLFIFLFL
jgi:phosphoribosyl-AMP cyclohydrolase